FASSFTLEAAAAVCDGEGADPGDALIGVAGLVEKSLLRVEERGGAARYWMLETIRSFAREKLRAAGEDERIFRRHGDWCLRLAAEAEHHAWGSPDQLVWLERIDGELGNVRAALGWLSEQDPAGAARLTAALLQFWRIREYRAEARRALATVIPRLEPGT